MYFFKIQGNEKAGTTIRRDQIHLHHVTVNPQKNLLSPNFYYNPVPKYIKSPFISCLRVMKKRKRL